LRVEVRGTWQDGSREDHKAVERRLRLGLSRHCTTIHRVGATLSRHLAGRPLRGYTLLLKAEFDAAPSIQVVETHSNRELALQRAIVRMEKRVMRRCRGR